MGEWLLVEKPTSYLEIRTCSIVEARVFILINAHPMLEYSSPYKINNIFSIINFVTTSPLISPPASLMEGRVVILPEQLLPPRPLDLFACPNHIYSSCLATEMVARQPECTLHSVIQLDQCKRRLRVSGM